MKKYCKQQIIQFLQWLLRLLDPPALAPAPGRYRVRPELAAAVGSADAAVLVDRLAYWLRRNAAENKATHFVNGKWWSYNSYQAWSDDALPWLSADQVRRLFMKLERLGVVQGIALKGRGKPKWYSIDEALLTTLTGAASPKTTLAKSPDTLANLPDTLAKSPDTPANLPALSQLESSDLNPSPNIQLDLLPPATPERDDAKLFSEWAGVFGKARATTQTQIAREVERIGLAPARIVAQRCADAQGKSWQYVLAALKNETPESPGAAPPPTPSPVATPPLLTTPPLDPPRQQGGELKPPPPRRGGIQDKAWEITRGQLELQCDRATWKMFLEPLELLAVEDGRYRLRAPNEYVRGMVQHRLARLIQPMLWGMAGGVGVEIEVVA